MNKNTIVYTASVPLRTTSKADLQESEHSICETNKAISKKF